ncbi:MAG: UDP-N-acetylmuramate--L-alanine ligase [Deltaproteobacteria bacterium]|nr:UDP-N-acetylmuramate--L-alanine ligase [Deltaproteobacteria bacterium]
MFRKRDVTIHFVGIGGIGMSGIAEVLLNLGYPVSGSDLHRSEVTDRLTTLGGRIGIGHDAKHVAAADVVVVSSAVRADNPEVLAARARDVPVIPRAEMLGELMRVKDGVAVAGSHGKTSTTTMLAAIFAEAGLDPTVIIGGKARALGSNARLGHGEILVAEADESDGSFRHLFPMVAIITNMDREHMDHYGTEAALRAAFLDFANKVPFYGLVVLCADDANTMSLAPELLKRHTSYGLTAGDYQGRIVRADSQGTQLELRIRNTIAGQLHVRIPGTHYAQNAVGAVAVAEFLGVPLSVCSKALENFQGVDRRFSVRGEARGVLVIDDYGHHPTEIAATIAAARLFNRRVVVAFQPHRFSRTQDQFAQFAPSLAGADCVFLTDVYAAGEAPIPGIDSKALCATFKGPVSYVPRARLQEALMAELKDGDLLLTLGAGDITRLAPEILARLSEVTP